VKRVELQSRMLKVETMVSIKSDDVERQRRLVRGLERGDGGEAARRARSILAIVERTMEILIEARGLLQREFETSPREDSPWPALSSPQARGRPRQTRRGRARLRTRRVSEVRRLWRGS